MKLKIALLAFGVLLYLYPTPVGLSDNAWHLFAIFITSILAVITNALPIITSSILALSAAVLTHTNIKTSI